MSSSNAKVMLISRELISINSFLEVQLPTYENILLLVVCVNWTRLDHRYLTLLGYDFLCRIWNHIRIFRKPWTG